MQDHKKTGPRDVFGNLLVMIGLYVSVISFGALIFSIINVYFPDILSYDTSSSARAGLRWPLAILVIVFPLYVWLNSYLERELIKHPEKRELRIRKWLLYFTLFATAIIIVTDLVSLIYRYLNGDITTRFTLKVFTVLLIAVSVFVYYIWNLRKEIPATKNLSMKLFVYGVILLSALAIIAGFIMAGSPTSERARRFDDRRVENLSSLQYQIINYWQTKEKLPENLDILKDDVTGFMIPTDPETEASYEYHIVSARQFELCGTFKTVSGETNVIGLSKPVPAPRGDPYGYDQTWQHKAERTCFTRTIDPDKFPPFKKR